VIEVTDTAAAIARVRAEENALPPEQRLFEDPWAHLFLGGPAGDAATALFDQFPFFRPGVRLRTRFIDDVVRTALADGFRELVILGAGFDCRSLRMSEIASARGRVYEVDFATQLHKKRTALEGAGVTLPPFIHFVPCDFRASDFEVALSRDLSAAGFAPAGRTLFIWEGVISYLEDADIARCLRWMAGTGGSGARLVFNYNVSRFDHAHVRSRVLAAGFATIADEPLSDTYRRYLAGDPPPGGEYFRLALAEV